MASVGATAPAPADAPLIPGRRRKATPEDIARINALLQQNFPLQPSTPTPAPAAPVAVAAAGPAS